MLQKRVCFQVCIVLACASITFFTAQLPLDVETKEAGG